MKKIYLTPETLVIDVENEEMIAESPTMSINSSDENAVSASDALGNEDRGSSIWDNEW